MLRIEQSIVTGFARATLVAALAASAVGCGASDPDSFGSESVENQEQALVTSISTLAGLRAMIPTGNYVLTADIDASATQAPGQEFVPIGDMWDPFVGTFDGGGHTINKLRIQSSGSATGMFGYASYASIQRVGLTNVNVRGLHQTGALVGVSTGTLITSSYVTGTVSGRSGGPWLGVGMMVGTAYSNTMLWKVYATGTLDGNVLQGGGLVGGAFGSDGQVQILEAFTDVNVNPSFVAGAGTTVSGGIVGISQGVWIEHAHSKGTVLGDYSGGILGQDVGGVPGYYMSGMKAVLTRSVVKVRNVPEPGYAGLIGKHNDMFIKCGGLWDTSVDAGVPRDAACHEKFTNQYGASGSGGFTTSELRNAHPAPNRVYIPYTYGELQSNGDGSDGHWDTAVWNYNSSSQLSTLRNIPNPSVQPL